MEQLENIAGAIEQILDEKDAVREVALKSSRTVVRLCGNAVRTMHKGKDASPTINEAMEELQKLTSITRDFPDIKHSGFVESAMQEYTEAKLFQSILAGQEMPTPENLGVTPEAYLLGMGDIIGELRRQALDHIRKGAVEKASGYLETMESLYEFLMRFHYPSSLVAIKRKQDIARGVLEKTRGEIAVAVRTHSLESNLKEM
jgi:translin